MQKQTKPIIERTPASTHEVHPHPVINRVLQNRGIASMADMEYSLSQLIEPFSMANMKQACIVLEGHLRKGSRFVIIGDFDCDGATSTSIAVAGLKMMGAKDVHFLIPDRVIHGYGLTPPIVSLAAELEPDIIVTVDNGIASLDGAAAVNKLERPCDLLITDHHLASDKGLPEACAIVNPNQPGCPFPSKSLAGCGVMFYVIMALRAHLRETDYFDVMDIKQPNIGTLLDLVALGTVADVVPLDKNNRILVEAGLNRIRMGHARPGIKAILEVAKRDPSKVTSSDMGFSLGPRINAAGRLEDMTLGIQCLLTEDVLFAETMAKRLDDLNQQRRDIEAGHVFDAVIDIESNSLNQKKGVVLFDPSWHPGVVGIVAARVKERLNRPIICMTDSGGAKEKRQELQHLINTNAHDDLIQACEAELQEKEVKGSARSIEGIHLKHVLDYISKLHPDILTKFGGHAMAAGLSLKYKNLERFVELFNHEVEKEITEAQMLGTIVVDIMNLDPRNISIDLAREFRKLGPWGQHFPEPNFHARFHSVKEPRIMKEKHAKFFVTMEGSPDQVFEAVAFNVVNDGVLPVGDFFEGAFTLDINEYRGRETLQLMLRDVQNPQDVLELKAEKEAIQPEKLSEPGIIEAAQVLSVDNKVSEAAPARVEGLSKLKHDNPVSKVRDDLQSALAAIREAGRRHKAATNDDPSPF